MQRVLTRCLGAGACRGSRILKRMVKGSPEADPPRSSTHRTFWTA